MKKFLILTLVLFVSFPAFAESKDDYPYYAKITCDLGIMNIDIDACFYYFDPKRPANITGITLTNLKNGTSIKKKWDTNYDSFRDIGYFICPKNKTCTWLRSEGKYETLYIDLPPDTRLDAENAWASATLTVELYERSTGQLLFKDSTDDTHGGSVVTVNTPTEIVEELKKEFEYEGEFKDGLRDGQGTLTFADGRMYVGEFKDGLKHGQGTYTWPDGDHYVGEFFLDKRHGQGKMIYDNGDLYEGEFKYDQRDGQGTYTWANGNHYVGEWKDGTYHGQGTYTWTDGTQYVGEFKDGLKHGQGTYTWTDGDHYVGEFKDGLRHGQGTLTSTDGTKDEGIWREGEFLYENIAVTQEDEKFCKEIGFTINTPEYDNCVQKSAEKD